MVCTHKAMIEVSVTLVAKKINALYVRGVHQLKFFIDTVYNIYIDT